MKSNQASPVARMKRAARDHQRAAIRPLAVKLVDLCGMSDYKIDNSLNMFGHDGRTGKYRRGEVVPTLNTCVRLANLAPPGDARTEALAILESIRRICAEKPARFHQDF